MAGPLTFFPRDELADLLLRYQQATREALLENSTETARATLACHRYPEMLLCRRIGTEHFEDAVTVMRWFSRCGAKGRSSHVRCRWRACDAPADEEIRAGPDELLEAHDEQGNYLPGD